MSLVLPDHWVWDFWIARGEDAWHLFYLKAPKPLGDPELRHRASHQADRWGAERDHVQGEVQIWDCLACHYIQGGTLMGNTGPGLIAMKQRFPEREKLVAQITDARTNNKNTFMPPFGAHGILSEQEIQLVVNWLYTL